MEFHLFKREGGDREQEDVKREENGKKAKTLISRNI